MCTGVRAHVLVRADAVGVALSEEGGPQEGGWARGLGGLNGVSGRRGALDCYLEAALIKNKFF